MPHEVRRRWKEDALENGIPVFCLSCKRLERIHRDHPDHGRFMDFINRGFEGVGVNGCPVCAEKYGIPELPALP